LRRIRVASKEELTQRIQRYIELCNEAPLMPKWSYGINRDPSHSPLDRVGNSRMMYYYLVTVISPTASLNLLDRPLTRPSAAWASRQDLNKGACEANT
jgi:hypothetical protein